MNDNGLNVIESLSHVAAVKITKIPQSKLTLITSKALPGGDSTSNMSDASSTCSPIDNSSMDSLNSIAEEAIARSGRSDGRNEDGPRTRSSSRRRSLGENQTETLFRCGPCTRVRVAVVLFFFICALLSNWDDIMEHVTDFSLSPLHPSFLSLFVSTPFIFLFLPPPAASLPSH